MSTVIRFGVSPDHDLPQQLQPVEASDDDVQLPVVFVQPAVLFVESFFGQFFLFVEPSRRSSRHSSASNG